MHQIGPNSVSPGARAATSTTPPRHDASPESPTHAAPRRPPATRDDGAAPAESVRVTDRPADKGGRAYLVERGLETKGELDALILDYLDQAAKLDSPPLAVPAPIGSTDADDEEPQR